MRLLVVEDDPDTLSLLQLLFEGDGYTVDAAGDVAFARQLAAAAPPDVVVTDIGLPDGGAAEFLRELQSRRPTPGIALTGYSEAEIPPEDRGAFAVHLTKPVDLKILRELIRQVTDPDYSPSSR
jgi:CheY-like chemotaxis protein